MATLDALKNALVDAVPGSSLKNPLSDAEYTAGYDILLGGSQRTYEFIIPKLSQIVTRLTNSSGHISVLEIGSGAKSVFCSIPEHLRRKIRKYQAFEPNGQSAASLTQLLDEKNDLFPCLVSPPKIRQAPFTLNLDQKSLLEDETVDLILFCHSMYGLNPKSGYIREALSLLRDDNSMVVVFHRDSLDLGGDGLVAHETASFPTGVVRVPVHNEGLLDSFASFIAGFGLGDFSLKKAEWRKVCHALGRLEGDQVIFSAPEVMVGFTRHATALPELAALVEPVFNRTVKNREACFHRPAGIVKPKGAAQVQRCVSWAIKHGFGLTVLGGGHSGHCLVPNVVAVDMSMFNQVYPVTSPPDSPLIVAGSGCSAGDIVREGMKVGLTVPLGARPSVGAGLRLLGGIGHLARLHGLASDSIVGAVVVSLKDGELLVVGNVPEEHQPTGSVRPDDEKDLLWALKGAGTNFGIVLSICFKAYADKKHLVQNRDLPNGDQSLKKFNTILANFESEGIPNAVSIDSFLYSDRGRLRLGVTLFEAVGAELKTPQGSTFITDPQKLLESNIPAKLVDGIGLFDAEMYMSGMHGGHGGGKTSAFKRCVFLQDIGSVADSLISAVQKRPTDLSYLHLLHGGGAVRDVHPQATAFGCRDWEFACVITGVWPRDRDGTDIARSAIEWVYKVVYDLLAMKSCTGVYAADLGPDPRDAPLVAKAFGPNLPRLSCLKLTWDPHNVLRYACPLPMTPLGPKLIILVTGESCAGKDHCADIWLWSFEGHNYRAQKSSISDETKKQYAAATGVNLSQLMSDRVYKEQHRPSLTEFYEKQLQQNPDLPQQHFLSLVYAAGEIDVLIITGMRDSFPLATFSSLVPDSQVIEVRVTASASTRAARGASSSSSSSSSSKNPSSSPRSAPTFTFFNDPKDPQGYYHHHHHHQQQQQQHPPAVTSITNVVSPGQFFTSTLLPFLSPSLPKLSSLIRPIPSYPRRGITFQHVLQIPQSPGGLKLCTSLLRSLHRTPWDQVSHVVACEAGGFVFASALAYATDKPLVIIRKAAVAATASSSAGTHAGNSSKLPPPLVSVVRRGGGSHISVCLENGDAARGAVEEHQRKRKSRRQGGTMMDKKVRK